MTLPRTLQSPWALLLRTPLPRTPAPADRVRQVAVPPAARTLSTLGRVHYGDAFLVEPGLAPGQVPEQWARELFDEAPSVMRRLLSAGWTSLGLKINAHRADGFVFGWEVRRATSDLLLLGAVSRSGMPAELLFKRHHDALLFATLIQHQNPLARAVWAGIAPGHRQIVRNLLEQAAARNARR